MLGSRSPSRSRRTEGRKPTAVFKPSLECVRGPPCVLRRRASSRFHVQILRCVAHNSHGCKKGCLFSQKQKSCSWHLASRLPVDIRAHCRAGQVTVDILCPVHTFHLGLWRAFLKELVGTCLAWLPGVYQVGSALSNAGSACMPTASHACQVHWFQRCLLLCHLQLLVEHPLLLILQLL